MGESPEESDRCGVVKLKGDGESTKLPYTMMVGAEWVPLAYFEGDVGFLFGTKVAQYFVLRL